MPGDSTVDYGAAGGATTGIKQGDTKEEADLAKQVTEVVGPRTIKEKSAEGSADRNAAWNAANPERVEKWEKEKANKKAAEEAQRFENYKADQSKQPSSSKTDDKKFDDYEKDERMAQGFDD